MRVRLTLQSQDHTLFLDDEGTVYGCGSVANGKLGVVISPGDPSFVVSPVEVGKKCTTFRKVAEIYAGPDHSLATVYDVLPEVHDDLSKFDGGSIYTFGMDRLGVSGFNVGAWFGKVECGNLGHSSPIE